MDRLIDGGGGVRVSLPESELRGLQGLLLRQGEVDRWWSVREGLPRRAWSRRGSARRHAARAQAAWDRIHAGLDASGAWDRLADAVIVAAVLEVREGEECTRHPFHPELLDRLEDVVATAYAVAVASSFSAYLRPGVRPLAVSAVPEIAQRITPARVLDLVVARVDRLSAVAEDPRLLVEHQHTEDGSPLLVVQHQASGLRARFAPGPEGIGSVFSKPYKIGSIDPADRGRRAGDQWEEYIGLGIGRVIYREGANCFPQQRWARGVTSQTAAGVRAALHAEDPYRWDGRCAWCAGRSLIWEHATADDFREHP